MKQLVLLSLAIASASAHNAEVQATTSLAIFLSCGVILVLMLSLVSKCPRSMLATQKNENRNKGDDNSARSPPNKKGLLTGKEQETVKDAELAVAPEDGGLWEEGMYRETPYSKRVPGGWSFTYRNATSSKNFIF